MQTFPAYEPILSYAAPQRIPRTPRVGVLDTGTCAPCGLARFAEGLARALSVDVASINAVTTGPPSQVDVAILQYEGGITGDNVVDIIDGLRVPTIVVVHTVPKSPTSQQRSALESIAAVADHVVVLSTAARQRLYLTYAVDRLKVTTIPHGATLPTVPRAKRPSRPTILTWGLLRPGKGIERVIAAMSSLRDVPGRPRYVVVGPMDPRAAVAEAEAYRDARLEQARNLGVADSVVFDSRYYDKSSLTDLIQQASVVVLPDDSRDQVSSGVLVDAFANGRPIVATAFPYAVELLGTGAGMVVDHDDPIALAAALRQIITQPRLAGAMAAEVRQRAPQVGWPVVAAAYTELAQRLIAERADTRRRAAETTGFRG